MNKEKALELLHANMQNVNLRRHCYAVGFALAGVYKYLKENNWKNDSPDSSEIWEVLGILHDSDYEKTKEDWTKHTILTQDWLKKTGMSNNDPLFLAVRSHNNKITKQREPLTQMEWALECLDELTGLIVAVALVKPDKKLESVSVDSILKKWNQKAFAAGVDRFQTEQCMEKLDIPLEVFIDIVLKSMQKHSDELGL
ncbi:hypothetical protein COV24_04185 [candidate division WWE3 bacterium CG10_big_fil_rev_8_21_14_0_10_32_10]|uniref:Phosphohydrolase n=1 Tax=candidate division WWE3 bacterium CG10_big_fil_rev_8_21_14_0_10_32_10 TaxID=1975090 RepID=A0A2H0R9X2_UNCKA|nr:MAG: hypothetical protein COV24_04185 [candidate division WWE3 bacterium CG10_big_fil_rev_8_21_14_0_10_32_10]